MTQSTSQPRSSEMILSLHWAQGTWNYIPDCFLTFPCPCANLSPSNPIVPYSLSLSFWFFMKSLLFIPPCARIGFCLLSSLHWVPTMMLLLKGKIWTPGKQKNSIQGNGDTPSLFNLASSSEREDRKLHRGEISIMFPVIPWNLFLSFVL